MPQKNTIAETNNFIVLDHFSQRNSIEEPAVSYQSESALEEEFIRDLMEQGYEYLDIGSAEDLLANARIQIQRLNDMEFSDHEWSRFVLEYLDKPNESLVEKTEKLHNNHCYDFVFDDGQIQNIFLVDKQNVSRNKVQVMR